eukprot:GHVU01207194.1.p1 GENE.GHVU01207194.1~~GHVU01207194.1.p1  ORF type:complete len:106 (+),score=16.10 GHVU01207194.1:228-545(+)
MLKLVNSKDGDYDVVVPAMDALRKANVLAFALGSIGKDDTIKIVKRFLTDADIDATIQSAEKSRTFVTKVGKQVEVRLRNPSLHVRSGQPPSLPIRLLHHFIPSG